MGAVLFRRKLSKVDLERMNLPEDYWMTKVQQVHSGGGMRSDVERLLHNTDAMMSKGVGLIVRGPIGVGKTTVAALMAKEARSRGYTTLFVRLWEFREMLRSRAQFDFDTTMSERAREVDLLILDDLRWEDEKAKFFTISDISELVLYRASRRRVTIITTRFRVQDFDLPPMDRFSEVLLFFHVDGPNLYDVRKRALEQVMFGS